MTDRNTGPAGAVEASAAPGPGELRPYSPRGVASYAEVRPPAGGRLAILGLEHVGDLCARARRARSRADQVCRGRRG